MPLAILQTIANRQVIVACSDLAAQQGIHPGLTLAQARAFCATLELVPYRPDLDTKGLEALAQYLVRFTPSVALGTRDVAETDAREPSPSPSAIDDAHLYLDLTGCEHLYGGLSPMVRTIAQAFHRLRIPATLAVAHTPGAAYALTCRPRTNRNPNVVESGVHSLVAATPETFYTTLPQLPLSSLRLPEEITQSLHHLGLETVAQLQGLPRDLLPGRFGKVILQRLDQLTGKQPEPLICQVDLPPLETTFDFDGSVADPQALELVFKDLLAQLLLKLERRGEGIRELQVRLKTYDSPQSLTFTIQVSRPSRDPRALLNLYRCAFDQLQTPKSLVSNRKYSRNYDVGFTSMTLKVLQSQLLPHQQTTIGQPTRDHSLHSWHNTLDLIRTRLGEEAIEQAELRESYLPEKAFRYLSAGVPEESIEETTLDAGRRPLHLISPPQEFYVMVSPSHDADGAPMSFNLEGLIHTVTHSIGPERIAGEWWERHHKTRDYFDIADEQGRRYWVFRVQETSKWYIHGLFE